jgi:hypothetical protein
MTDTKTLSGAALKVRLGGLGLPPSFFAERAGVTMRTVVRWFDSTAVPAAAADLLDKLEERTLAEMWTTIEKLGDSDDVTLMTYRTDGNVSSKHGKWPASWHRSLIFRVLEHLEAQGRNVTVTYR